MQRCCYLGEILNESMVKVGISQFIIPSTLEGSIFTLLGPIIKPRNSISHCLKKHFSGFRNKSLACNLHKTSWTISLCSSSVFVKIRISSMYTMTTTAISWKISFIIVRNVPGELHSPKNITKGSNVPSWQVNATFYSSPSLIWTLL